MRIIIKQIFLRIYPQICTFVNCFVDKDNIFGDKPVRRFFLFETQKFISDIVSKLVGGNVIHFTATIETKVGKDLKVYFHLPLRLWLIRKLRLTGLQIIGQPILRF